MPTDIEISQRAKMLPILEIARGLGLSREDFEPYGDYKGKLKLHLLERLQGRPDGKLVLVTAITPTPLGEGKTLTTVGLGQALSRLGRKSLVTLREPSLGPVFGLKGGAAGGGYSQVLPMEDINLHFTGDLHAVGAAHNLLAAMLDNHLLHGNELRIDINQVMWRRVIDMNDRALRYVVIGLGGSPHGIPRQDRFMITAASEVMAVLCLCDGLSDLKRRLGDMVIAFTAKGEPVTARDLQAAGAMALLLKDAVKPNLVQTIENTPALIHGGPFGNIAHGTNSILAIRMALKLADYVVTEAGFGSELGAEKFLDITARTAGFSVDAAVLVATCRSLKMHGGGPFKGMADLEREDLGALERGLENLKKHVENLRVLGLPTVVSLNRFALDTEGEVRLVEARCRDLEVEFSVSDFYARGGEGGKELARKVEMLANQPGPRGRPLYDLHLSIREKIERIATTMYGAKGIFYDKELERKIAHLSSLGFDRLPVCISKTQASLSDNPALKGVPTGWELHVMDLRVSAGAGFTVAIAGDIMHMPGLSRVPAATKMDILDDGTVVGLF